MSGKKNLPIDLKPSNNMETDIFLTTGQTQTEVIEITR